jgi:endonuclease/exonuclease/phosphatase (EEP) superfamily protein YafD
MGGAFTSVVMSYNLWGNRHWERREPALRALLEKRAPDILAVQELSPVSKQLIDEVLTEHDRVEDAFPGWSFHGNLWWRRDLYELLAYGAEDIGIRAKQSRLFWVRLRPTGFGTGSSSGPELVVSTAHYTWAGNQQERLDDVNPRVGQARRTVTALDRLAGSGPCVFAVDLNDFARPLWALREAGFVDSFSALGSVSPVTHPVIPTALDLAGEVGPGSVPKAIDWQFHRGTGIRVRTSEVVDFFHAGVAPSDHKPVVAAYTLDEPPPAPADPAAADPAPRK